MKGAADRTKVVLRQLPPTITQSMLMEQIDGRFAGRYNWVSFRPGNNSQKHHSYSRAYINFQRPDDVIEFAEFFDGHVFVNEKGTQFKTIVEYAPSQRVPKLSPKKDGREGTIYNDPEYMEFLEMIGKPVENLPSAEIQLERKEAERAGVPKDAPIVTPLMDFVRQKRAAKGGSRRPLSDGKPIRRTGGTSSGSPSSTSSQRGSEKRRNSTTMYVARDTGKSNSGGKDKSAYVIVPEQDDQQISEKPLDEESGVSGLTDSGKKKILLLKGKEKEIPNVSPVKNSNVARQNHRREAGGNIIRSILLNKDSRQMQTQASNQDKDKRPPRPPNVQSFFKDTNGAQEDRGITRNRDRNERGGIWTPLRRSDGPHASNESLSSSTSQHTQSSLDPGEVTHGDTKNDMLRTRSGELRHTGGGRSGHLSADNGYYRHGGRRGPPYNGKDADGSSIIGEGKPLKKGVSSGYGGPHEKKVWVQKSSSGS